MKKIFIQFKHSLDAWFQTELATRDRSAAFRATVVTVLLLNVLCIIIYLVRAIS